VAKNILKPNRIFLILSFIILFVQLVLVIVFGFRLDESKKEANKQLAILEDQFFERSFEFYKLSNDIHRILTYKHENLGFEKVKSEIYERSMFFLGHRNQVQLTINESSQVLLKGRDPLFLRDQHRELLAEYHAILEDFQNNLDLIKGAQSEDELNILLPTFLKTVQDIHSLLNQFNNIFSNLTSYYQSYNKSLTEKTSRNIDIFLSLVVIMAILSITLVTLSVLTKRKSDKSLRSNEKMLRMVAANFPAYLSLINKNMTVDFSSGKEFEKTDLDPQALAGLTLEKVFFEHTPVVKKHYQKAFQGHEVTFELNINNQHQLYNVCPLPDEKDRINQILSVAENITERKKDEEQIKASLKDKEILLQEIHHRVKNNMQVIASLLKLQADKVDDIRIKEALKESQGRVYAMSAVHEMLYGSENLSEIDLKSYLSKISKALQQSNQSDPGKVRLNIEADETTLGIEKASHLGLVINELISNSLKHAFPDKKKGNICVSMKKLNDKYLELTISDDGIGLPHDLDWRNTDTLGLQLVTTLV